jgi:hypothetical protein
MRTKVDLVLRHEAAAFAFRFACEDCVHWSGAQVNACTLEYPAEPKRSAIDDDTLVFCKEFDLGASEGS